MAVLNAKEEYHKKEKNYKLDIDSIGLKTDPSIDWP